MFRDTISNYSFSNRFFFEPNRPIHYDPDVAIKRFLATKKGICMDSNMWFYRKIKYLNDETKLVRCYKVGHPGKTEDLFHLGIVSRIGRDNYFIDVGYGDVFIEPVKLVNGEYGNVLVQKDNDGWLIRRKDTGKIVLHVRSEETNLVEIKHSYYKLLNETSSDVVPLLKTLYENIYDPLRGKYIELTKIKF